MDALSRIPGVCVDRHGGRVCDERQRHRGRADLSDHVRESDKRPVAHPTELRRPPRHRRHLRPSPARLTRRPSRRRKRRRPILAAELEAAIDNAGLGTSGVGADAPIAPGQASTFTVTVTSNETKFSLVSMIICTNDGFVGADQKRLPRADGETVTYTLRGYDAGTEINTENRADLVPAPFCGDGQGTGATNPSLAENGVIRVHRTLQGTGDPPTPSTGTTTSPASPSRAGANPGHSPGLTPVTRRG